MYTVYGIKNCNTMKKAFNYLSDKGIDYTFVDYKKQAPNIEALQRWLNGFGELPVNKKGTTYRKLKDSYENASPAEQMALLQANPSAIKRPILESDDLLIKGFEAELWPDS